MLHEAETLWDFFNPSLDLCQLQLDVIRMSPFMVECVFLFSLFHGLY